MDRWNIVSTLNYLNEEKELNIINSKVKSFPKKFGKKNTSMINLANLTK